MNPNREEARTITKYLSTISSPAVLTVTSPAPPVIVSQPNSQTLPEGQPASFSVTATNLSVVLVAGQKSEPGLLFKMAQEDVETRFRFYE